MKDREPVVYGKICGPVRFTTAADIIELKKAGVSDEVLQAIVAVNRRDSDVDRDAALKQLRDMGESGWTCTAEVGRRRRHARGVEHDDGNRTAAGA